MVTFGNASGPVPPLNLATLAAKGSLYVTRPTLMTYAAKREDFVASATALFEAVKNGVKIEINQTFSLKDTAEAHRALEGRKTTGRSEEHTSELQSLMRNSYAVFC